MGIGIPRGRAKAASLSCLQPAFWRLYVRAVHGLDVAVVVAVMRVLLLLLLLPLHCSLLLPPRSQNIQSALEQVCM
jgi:hypothetical protein